MHAACYLMWYVLITSSACVFCELLFDVCYFFMFLCFL
jgi:hypothetical protein